MIEGNLCRAGMRVPQMCNGPIFGDRTPEILNKIFKK